VAAELFHEDRQTGRQTDIMKLIFTFRTFLSVPKLVLNPLNAELNPICRLLALLGGATIVVVSRLRVKEVGCEGLNWLLASDKDW